MYFVYQFTASYEWITATIVSIYEIDCYINLELGPIINHFDRFSLSLPDSIDNILSYSIPVGSAWSDVFTVDDLSYDGLKETNVWANGLGMLTDGQYGLDNFKMDLGARKGM